MEDPLVYILATYVFSTSYVASIVRAITTIEGQVPRSSQTSVF